MRFGPDCVPTAVQAGAPTNPFPGMPRPSAHQDLDSNVDLKDFGR